MTLSEIGDKIAEILAGADGVEPSQPEFVRYQRQAGELTSACFYAPPADPTGELGDLLSTYYEIVAAGRAEAQARAEASAARIKAMKEARDRPEGLKAGFVRLTLKDEATGRHFAIDLPSEQVRQVGR